MIGEAEIEQPPGATDVAADAGIHEAGEQRHARDPEEIRLRIDPGADRGLEDFHYRADGVIDQDDFGLLPRLHAQREQRGLDRDHAEEEEIVAR